MIQSEDQHMKYFKIILLFILSLVLVYPFSLLDTWNIIPVRTYSSADFNISEYYSNSDFDQDGIDDAHDLMIGAREFVESGLKYKSAYYDGGYPTDEYSVCTDVIWNAFFSAGYSLKDLIDEDIANYTDFYSIDVPDSNIDFRRVKNLKIFFDRHAESLTLNIYDIDQWQPGDIVTFAPSHIGIISDKRNSDGIPYLIHHSGQPNKEEDCIVKRDMKITGHYRWK